MSHVTLLSRVISSNDLSLVWCPGLYTHSKARIPWSCVYIGTTTTLPTLIICLPSERTQVIPQYISVRRADLQWTSLLNVFKLFYYLIFHCIGPETIQFVRRAGSLDPFRLALNCVSKP